MWRPELSFTFLFFFLKEISLKKTPKNPKHRLPLKKTPLKRNKNFQKRAPLAAQLLYARF